MKKETEQVKKVKIIEYYCDECDGKADNGCGSPYICKICFRHFCQHHIVLDDRDWGDYPDRYCQHCWNIGQKYRDKIDDIDRKADEEKDQQNKEWHKEAKENKKLQEELESLKNRR